MAQTREDDRTFEEIANNTYPVLIVAYDRAMSGWGGAIGGKSYAVWACTEADSDKVFNWVKNRGDLSKVQRLSVFYPKGKNDHVHIYVARPGHPSLQ